MEAVNLIPIDQRSAGVSAPGAPFLGLLGALCLALAGTVAYVDAHNTVTARQNELTQVRVRAAEWSAAAARYVPAVTAVAQREKQFSAVGSLVGERYDWSVLLGQLAGVMPAHAELASLSAATPSTASSAGSVSAAGSSTAPGVAISGCATSQAVVADTMVALRRLSNVSQVSLASSTRQGAGAASGSSGGTGACTLPVDFVLSLTFAPSSAKVTLPGATNPSATSSTGAAPAAAATSGSTGAAQ